MTPSGKPTKDLLRGKVIPLDPLTKDYHIYKSEDIEAYKQTDERRIEQWLVKRENSQELSQSSTSLTYNTPSNHDTTNNNNFKLLIIQELDHCNQPSRLRTGLTPAQGSSYGNPCLCFLEMIVDNACT
jgi:hypothetical protein